MNSFDFDLEMIAMARVKGLRIREIAIPTDYADEVSHLKPIRYGLRVLSVVYSYRRGRYDRLVAWVLRHAPCVVDTRRWSETPSASPGATGREIRAAGAKRRKREFVERLAEVGAG